MPMFHLLLAAAILITETESTKVRRLFSALNIPNVKQRQLSNLFKCYIIPAVFKVCTGHTTLYWTHKLLRYENRRVCLKKTNIASKHVSFKWLVVFYKIFLTFLHFIVDKSKKFQCDLVGIAEALAKVFGRK